MEIFYLRGYRRSLCAVEELSNSTKKNFFGHKIHFLFPGLNFKDEKSVIQSVQTVLQPDIERRLAAKKRLDDLAVSTLLENINILEKSLNSRRDSQAHAVPSTSHTNN